MIIDPFLLSLSFFLPYLHIVHHNNMYCHTIIYCQKAFVPSMCAHCFYLLPVDAKSWEKPFFPAFLFGTSAIWFKWASLQLASLQLWRFMNCCTVHWRCSYYHLLAFCLPEKFFFFSLPFCWQIISSFQGKRMHHLTALLWKWNIFLLLNLLFLMFDRFVSQRIAVKQINFREVWAYLCETPVLLLFQTDLTKYLPDLLCDEESMALSPCVSFSCRLFLF